MLVRAFFLMVLVVIDVSAAAQLIKNDDEPVIKAIHSRNNFLYAGIDNAVFINDTLLNEDQYTAKAMDAHIFKADTGNMSFTVIPNRAGNITISVCRLSDEDTSVVYSEELKSRYLPKPLLTVDGNVIRNKVIDRKILDKADSIGLFITNDITNIDEWYDVVGFKFGFNFEGIYDMHYNIGNTCTAETKIIMSNLYPGSEVKFRVSVKSRTDVLIKSQTYEFLVY